MGSKQLSKLSTKSWVLVFLSVLALLGLILASQYDYLLFHLIVECFSILVAGAMFVLVWNTWSFTENGYFKFLGIAFFFIGALDFVHTIGYKGMRIFAGYGVDLSTQLWIAARYLQSISLVVAPTFLKRRVKRDALVGIYLILFVILLVLIFGRIFPDCYIEGEGLTSFKIGSEYIISLLLGLAIFRLFRHKEAFSRDVFLWMVVSIVFTILSELTFTFYVGVYDPSNLAGHIFKIAAFYFIYRAIIETGLRRPYTLLFRDMQQLLTAHQDSEAKFRSYVENAPYGVFVADQDGCYVEVNEAACRITGYTRDELLSMRIDQLVPHEYAAAAAEHFRSVVEEGYATGEEAFVRADGSMRWWSVIALRLSDTRFLAYTEDVTERRRAEEALRESEERYRQMFADHTAVMFLIDPTDGKIVGANHAAAEFYGLPIDELQQLGIHDINHLPVSEVITRMEEAALREQNYFVFQHRLASGETRDVEVHSVPIRIEGRTLLYSIIHDITKRRQAEMALETSEKRFRLTVHSSPIGVGIVDSTGQITDCNDALAAMVGYSREELLQLNFEDFTHPDDLEREWQLIDELWGEEITEYRMEKRYIHKDGHTIWVDVAASLFKDEADELAFGFAFVQDITKRKRAAKELQESRALLRQVIDLVPYPIYAKDDQGRFVLVNQAGARFAGSTIEQMEGHLEEEWVVDEDVLRQIQADDRAVIERGEPTVFPDQALIDAHGQERVMQTMKIPFLNEEGEISGVLGISIDITDLKQIEKELRRTGERLRIQHAVDKAILSAQSPDDIARAALMRLRDLLPFQRASITEIDQANHRGRDVVVLTDDPGEKVGSGWHSLSEAHPIVTSLQKGEVHLIDDLAARKDPSPLERILAISGARSAVSVPLMIQDMLIGSLNLVFDKPGFFQPGHTEILEEIAASLAVALQQARLLEQTQRDAEEKALLLREVNHRTLNNLTMILSLISMEQRRLLDDEADFQAALQDISRRIGSMTTVHRMLSGGQWAPLNLAEVVKKVIQAALSGSPIEHAVEVVVEGPDDPLLVTSKRAVAVALVINELTTNSVKYAFHDRSRGQIHVRIARADGDTEKVELIFRDDGPGMPDDVLAGERSNVGIWLVMANVMHTLDGEVSLHNDRGAVASIVFKRDPLS